MNNKLKNILFIIKIFIRAEPDKCSARPPDSPVTLASTRHSVAGITSLCCEKHLLCLKSQCIIVSQK